MKIETLSDGAKNYIEEGIGSGEFLPGQQLKEEEIARRLAISRPPIREAFKLLEAQGLVVRRPRHGVFVSEITEKDIWEVYTLKAVLYEMAIGLAIEKLTPSDIGRLDRLIDKMDKCVQKKPPEIPRYQKAHREFHSVILEASNNRRLVDVATTLHQQVRQYSYKSLQNNEHLQSSLKYHREIVLAIKERDAARARTLTREHVLVGLHVLIDGFEFEVLESDCIPMWENPLKPETEQLLPDGSALSMCSEDDRS
jgi:DNA-binding GntR family transcriptional regulator